MRAAAACAGCLGGLLLSCSQPAPAEPPLDATALKLKALAEAPPPPPRPATADIQERLGARATRDSDRSRSLPLPADNPTAWAGPVALKLAKLTTASRVGSGKLQLTTDQSFLLVTLLAQDAGKAPAEVELSTARVTWPGGGEASLAPDVQRLLGTSPSLRTLSPGGEEHREEWVLAFELPEAALSPGLVLGVAGAKIPLL